jgi:hypothetical protein
MKIYKERSLRSFAFLLSLDSLIPQGIRKKRITLIYSFYQSLHIVTWYHVIQHTFRLQKHHTHILPMGKRIYITAQEIADLHGKHYMTGIRMYNAIKTALGKDKKHHKLTVQEYATYEGISLSEVTAALSKKPIAA